MKWLLDSDPAVRWQVLRDLADAPREVVAAERARVATEGWGARLLALRDEDGQWAGGAYVPAQRERADEEQSSGDHTDDGGEEAQPWTATTYSLLLLRDLGVDPQDDQVRETVALVSNNCRWEEGGQRYFDGEVEPCINGMTVALGAYFGQAVDGVVARLLDEQRGRRVELLGGLRFQTVVVRDDDQCARRAAGPRAVDGWVSCDRRRAASWGRVPPRTRAISAQEHRRDRAAGLVAVLVSDPLALRRPAGSGVLPIIRR